MGPHFFVQRNNLTVVIIAEHPVWYEQAVCLLFVSFSSVDLKNLPDLRPSCFKIDFIMKLKEKEAETDLY